MRQISIITAAALFGVIAALLGATAHVPQKAVAAAASSSIDITEMTRDAKGLPVEQFDAN